MTDFTYATINASVVACIGGLLAAEYVPWRLFYGIAVGLLVLYVLGSALPQRWQQYLLGASVGVMIAYTDLYLRTIAPEVTNLFWFGLFLLAVGLSGETLQRGETDA